MAIINQTTIEQNIHMNTNTTNTPVSEKDESIYSQLMKSAATQIEGSKFIIHKNTKNKSFIRLHHDLKKLGVKNNKFFLALYDKDLQFIDPYSPHLPKDMQLKVFLEIVVNPWYFLREILRIPEPASPIEVGGGSQYNIDRNNIAAWYLFLNGIDHYQSKPRQRGKTQDALAKINYAYNFGTLSSHMLFFNKDGPQAIENLGRLKDQIALLPEWLQMRFVVDEDGKIDSGTDNAKSIKNPVTGNRITTMGKAISKMTAQKLGRGSTAPIMYFDEFDFMPFNTEVMGAAVFAYSTAASIARKKGALYGRILTSTPGDLDTRDGKTATEYINRMLVWKDSMFDEPIEKIRDTVNSNSYNRFVFVEHNWQQLNLSRKWFETQCGLVNFEQEKILREILLKRIGGSDRSPFRREDILYLTKNVKRPIKSIDITHTLVPINIYETLNPRTPYLLGVDPSEGLSGDNCSFTLTNPYTQKPVAEFKSPYIHQPDLFDILYHFMDSYCPKSMVIIENNRGRELINLFLKSKFRNNLYYDSTKAGKVNPEAVNKYGNVVKQASQRRAIGLLTHNNRTEYYNILEHLVLQRKELLRTEYIVDDVASLIRTATGRIEAGPGKHDDNIMSYLFTLYVYNISSAEVLERYGIYRGMQDESELYDAGGNITQEGTLLKLKSMLPNLPQNLQEMIMGTIRDNKKTEAHDINKAYGEIREADEESFNYELERNELMGVPMEQFSSEGFFGEYNGNPRQNQQQQIFRPSNQNIYDDDYEQEMNTFDFDVEDYF